MSKNKKIKKYSQKKKTQNLVSKIENVALEQAVEAEKKQVEINQTTSPVLIENSTQNVILEKSTQDEQKTISQTIKQIDDDVQDLGKNGLDMLDNKSFWQHFNDFKNTFLKILLSWVIGMGIAYYFRDTILSLITWPLGPTYRLHFLYPAEGFTYLFKIYAVAGLLIAFPVILIILWYYIKDALRTKEKGFILLYILSAVLMATFGTVYGFYSLLPSSLQILLNIQPQNTEVILSASEYINFVIAMLLILIVVFQTPILIYSLIKTGLIKASFFKSKRKEIYLFVAIVSAVVTPTPDILTMVLLMLPIIVLFEIALFVATLGSKTST